ncbi:hypothetical protein Val02_24180 [Virgisporangium aliadipatigenens]|uniref:Uncharacterized protein n=1 Tax=Virgisporangium aliadipatigenens TaxID=741659 RepID=A0A8J3YJQ1_9ACTN|nr:hypothetical protein [Virgisporangium aliadipatigenens]GIJ45532.1 hypothetical protein Val02_24180 [Virgisporangium aliadipatigenens]
MIWYRSRPASSSARTGPQPSRSGGGVEFALDADEAGAARRVAVAVLQPVRGVPGGPVDGPRVQRPARRGRGAEQRYDETGDGGGQPERPNPGE